jgi:hypothetical protein
MDIVTPGQILAPGNSAWQSLPAGRDLDELVAEKVMGRNKANDVPGAGYRPPRSYSTDISAAWKVIKKIKALVCDLENPCDITITLGTDGWVVAIGIGDRQSEKFVVAKTVPLAICRAALTLVTVLAEGQVS